MMPSVGGYGPAEGWGEGMLKGGSSGEEDDFGEGDYEWGMGEGEFGREAWDEGDE